MYVREHVDIGCFGEQERLQEVQKYAFLEHHSAYSNDHLVELTISVFNTKTALVTLIEKDRQWFQARVGFDHHETSRTISLCAHALRSESVLVIPDTQDDPRFASNILVTGDPFIRFYAGAPLVTPRGFVIGTLCIIDDKPRPGFSTEDQSRLQSFAKLVMDQLELKRLSEAQRTALSLSRTTADGILHVTFPDRITYSNAGASKILGYDRSEFLARSLLELIPSELSRKVEAASKRFLRSGKPYASIGGIEANLRTKSGEEIPVEFSAGIWQSDGRAHLGVILRDITERKRREASFQMMFERNPVPMWISDAETLRFVEVNDAACLLYGYSRPSLKQTSVFDLFPADERRTWVEHIAAIGDSYEPKEPWTQIVTDGKHVRVLPFARRIQHAGKPCILAAMIDVTERERAATELKSTRIFLDAIVESIPSMLFVKDVKDGRFVLMNKAGEDLLGLSRDEIIGKTDHDFFAEEDAERFIHADRAVVSGGELVVIENEPVPTSKGLRSLRTQKVGVPDAEGKPRFLLGVSEDVTERLAMEKRNLHLSRHDILTELPNRLAFQDLLSEQLHSAVSAEAFALYLIDLDSFKSVNDSLGHQAGDELLRQVATRLNAAKADADVVARLGGDEFAIFQPHCVSAESATNLATKIVSELARPFALDGQEVVIGCSVGITLYPANGANADELLRRSDLALYHVKERRGGGFAFFEPAMEWRANRERRLRDELRLALERNELRLVYQPIVDAQNEGTVCCEALLRWDHPELGAVSPTEFIPAAEAAGLIPAIGLWVMEQACLEAANWPSDVRIAVNLSPLQFTGFNLAKQVAVALEQSGLLPNRLELEITEGIFLRDSQENLDILRQLKNLGVRIALDDFGTGYSSLSYLCSFAFDKIKIDRSFIAGLPASNDSLSIVRAIIGLGKSFRATVTAEGVETRAQTEALIREGCDQCQGYLYSKPLEQSEIRSRLAARQILQGTHSNLLCSAHL